ncbi:DUF2892 domain-containing protein [Methylotuvimicrobium alcaliphilum]|uniref:DUF2892 domain-containing protein n=1 Tax=Methylotuvimicrobium alcaliphilum (strain DSM 19304 / NCIMB 14124 / VKM B-2133 / 20Z) TaxID=1091494 RepID=G4SX73_META2|nr:DUF2892 domain-containing protein [Methylotuvimicrobium alcaliphilum]CCE24229.1 conserved protein of unknown function [Methylotuvimicrobium alcaliphilum 20Z]
MSIFNAEDSTRSSLDRVRSSTAAHVNEEIDLQTDLNIQEYKSKSKAEILERIQMLDKEWDVERVLEVNASTLSLTGLILGLTKNPKWLFLPGIVLPFLLQHGLQGWCPPLPLLRRLGIRTRGEIDREKYALKLRLEKN